MLFRSRPGAVFVVNQSSRETVYDPPDAGQLEGLILELVTYLGAKPRRSAYVSAAMAHLNLTLIHPFKDGNGRMARALQTLILAREGLVNPVFSSIEEWLGQNTEAYYSVLTAVAQGAWSPGNSALPWVRFCLRAHYQQADRMIRRFDEYDALYAEVATIVARLRLNDRVSMPLFDCALGQHMTNTRYQKETGVSQFVSGRDLKDLADLGLLQPFGEKRGRFYRAGSDLKAAYARVRIRVASIDPYLSASDSPNQEPRLPGL